MFDDRLLRIGIETRGRIAWFEGLAIEASVTKTTAITANEATVKITNLSKSTRDAILTETSPWNKIATRKSIVIEAGRKSYGYSRIFSGDIMSASPAQPPDITITITAKTNAWNKGAVISQSYGATTQARTVAGDIADSMGLVLQYDAQDKRLGSYTFTGSKADQLRKLQELGGVDAYIDDGVLVVQTLGRVRSATAALQVSDVLSAESGMVGIPEATEHGVKVKMMFEPHSKCGAEVNVRSIINPALSGRYIIFKMQYDLCNRSEPFYNTIEAYTRGRYIQ